MYVVFNISITYLNAIYKIRKPANTNFNLKKILRLEL